MSNSLCDLAATGQAVWLAERGRKVLRIDLGEKIGACLARLASALAPALG